MIKYSMRKKVVWLNIVVMFNHRCNNSLWFKNDVFKNIKYVFGDKVGVVT
jgi:hypothetical protein